MPCSVVGNYERAGGAPTNASVMPQQVGKAIAALIMILGYSIIVVPTGFVSSSIVNYNRTEHVCDRCKEPLHSLTNKSSHNINDDDII